MHIKKIGHCCLVVEVDGAKIMTDPGSYTAGEHEKETGIDAVVISHEHGDHFHIESLKALLLNNPQAKVITNAAVGKLLDTEGIAHEVVDGTAKTMIKNVEIEAFDAKHEEIFEEIGQVQNTAYWIAGKLFVPGDAFADPGKPIDILAWPVGGPFCRVSEVLRYAITLKPRAAFPVHDGMNPPQMSNFTFGLYEKILKERANTTFTKLNNGDEEEF